MDVPMDWTTDRFLDELYKEHVQLHKKGTQGGQSLREAAERRSQVRASLQRALGTFPSERVPLTACLLERVEYEDYVLERVAYTTMRAVSVPVLVLVPKEGTGPWPAVLACHGHGNGQRDAVGLDAEGQELGEPGIHNRFAVQLVKQGMVVVIPEIMGFGVRRIAEELKSRPDYSSCSTLSSHLLMYGKTLAGMRVYEAMRALDYMGERKDVDPNRLGVFGFSGGGLIAAYTAALDERIQAAVLCGWTHTFRGSILAMPHCIDNYLPGLLLDAEQPELVSLIAPRPLFVESGEQDPIFPVEHVRQAIAELEFVYENERAASCFCSEIHDGAHQISGRQSVPWLHRQLVRPLR